MMRKTFFLVVTSVTLSAVAQLVLKGGMASATVQSSLAAQPSIGTLIAVFGNWRVLLGLFIYFLSAAVWLLVLSRLDVSLAYPFVGLGFVLTMILGWLVRGEVLSINRVTGTFLIVGGIIFLARSA
jgi:multidrug transporter EmrE-like cation transporter